MWCTIHHFHIRISFLFVKGFHNFINISIGIFRFVPREISTYVIENIIKLYFLHLQGKRSHYFISLSAGNNHQIQWFSPVLKAIYMHKNILLFHIWIWLPQKFYFPLLPPYLPVLNINSFYEPAVHTHLTK